MQHSILFEAITDLGFPEGYFYAHIPALDLTTHGEGIEGAKAAALDLIILWIEERRARGEPVAVEAEFNRL